MATNVGTLQSNLTLDFSQFAAGMNSAISMVKSLGKQLSKALGSNTTQGFSTTNQAVNTLQTSITNLQAFVANFQATMQNTNTTLAQFSKVQATTSRTGQNLKNASHSAKQTAKQTGNVSNNAKKAANNAKKLNNHLDASKAVASDLKRILGGIVISQAFYKLLGAMQDLVSSSIQFMTTMEQSAIAFKYLLGSIEDSAGFLEALQDFAVASPMDMKGAETSARMLMTMGFQAESTISVLRILTDAATVAGGELGDTVNRISLALGQMLQSGTVKMQEIRQLVNANIPIFEILQEELGLTAEQVANIGKEGVDSGKAVTAILIGLQRRFGGASKEMQLTVTGALSAARDSFYILFNEVMGTPYENFRQKVVDLSNVMQYLAQTARQLGAGGIFEAIIPKHLHGVIRNVVGALMQLVTAIQFLGRIVKQVFGGMFEIMVQILNIVLPPITILINAIMQFTYGLLRAFPVLKYFLSALVMLAIAKPIGAIFLWFWKVIGLGKIIMLVVGYIQSMIKALMTLGIVLLGHPIVLAISAITITVLALTGVLQKAINKIKEFFGLLGANITRSDKTVNKNMGIGYDPNTILQPTNKETNDYADKYKESLKEIKTGLEDVGDEANRTKNKLKNAFNQSFDEVYGINPNTGNDLGLSGLENIDLSGVLAELEGLNDVIDDLGDFDFSDDWSDNFMVSWAEMWNKIKERIKEFGIPALFAGVSAGIISGNPWVGLAAGLAALFWPEISNALGLTKEQGNRILGESVGVLVGGAIGMIIGGPGGALIGAAIGLFCGDVVALLVEGFKTGNWNVPELSFSIASGLGVAIGFIVGGPAGAVIGAAIGGLVGWIAGKFYEADWSAVWDAFKERLFGEGGLFGWSMEMFEIAGEFFSDIADAFAEGDWARIGKDLLLGILNGIAGALTFIFEPIARLFQAIWEAICEIFGIHSPAKEMEPIGENVLFGILEGILGAVTAISGYIAEAGAALISAIGDWFVGIGDKVTEWFDDGVTSIETFVSNTSTDIQTWAANRVVDFENFKTRTGEKISSWAASAESSISNWANDTEQDISSWWSKVKVKFDDFKSISFTGWCDSTFTTITNWCSDVWGTIKDKIGNAIDKVKEFLGLSSNNTGISVNANVSGGLGHANGGVFNREHWARFSEGNKAEAIIPLENASAMQPFVDAVSNGLTATLAPMLANAGGGNNLQPLYVGTLIADERGLKELERKMEIIRVKEERR